MPEYQAALRSYEHAITLDPQYLSACTNQVDLHTVIAEHNDAIGIDPRSAVDSARRIGERCLGIDPNFYGILDNLVQAQLALAHHLVESGGDPRPALISARDYIDRAEKVQPETMTLWFRRLVAARTEATFWAHQRADPTNSVATGRAALRQALRLGSASAAASAYFYIEAARLDLIEAAWAAHAASGEMPLLTRALHDAQKAVELNARLADAKLTAAEVCLQIATAQPSRAIVELGIAYAKQALERNPRLLKAQTLLAALMQRRGP
jgi:tetratricopeptide (TPR) repeat protein